MIEAPPALEFRIVRRRQMNTALALDVSRAVKVFTQETNDVPGIDQMGAFRISIEAVQDALDGRGDLWVGTMDGALVIYILANTTNELDGHSTYWVSQAWVLPSERGQAWVKDVWQQIRAHAKEHFCKHIVAISGRANNEAYCRFLGRGWHVYGTLLKEDLDG